jgi:hypothetical protein
MRSRHVLIALAAAAWIGLGAAQTGAATHTMVPRDCTHEAFKPSKIVIACGDGNLFMTGIRWSHWRRKSALGAGTAHINDCIPNCAMGHFRKGRAKIRLSSAHFCRGAGVTQFRRLRMTWVNEPPAGTLKVVAVPVTCPSS